MKYWHLITALVLSSLALALDGEIGIHDPSTVVKCNGKFYTYGTGGSSLVSEDGWTWRRGTARPRRGLAPDVIHMGDRYYMYVAANIGAQPKAAINMLWNKTLDPDSPDYKWEEGGVVASSDGVEDCNAIDPGAFLDPNDGRLWLVYGSLFRLYPAWWSSIPRPASGSIPNDQPRNLAINCEASDMMYHDGWYYLLATHGSCCRGTDSGYNIRVGRAKKVIRPFPRSRRCRHDSGRWKAVDRLRRPVRRAGTFRAPRSRRQRAEILAALGSRYGPGRRQRSRYSSAAVEGRMAHCRREPGLKEFMRSNRFARGRLLKRQWRECPSGVGTREEAAEEVPARPRAKAGCSPGPEPRLRRRMSRKWKRIGPSGEMNVRMANYLVQAQQKWEVVPVTSRRGGYPGSPYFKITIAGTERSARGDRRCGVGNSARIHRCAGTALANGPAPGRFLAHHAKADRELAGAAGAFRSGQQLRDAV